MNHITDPRKLLVKVAQILEHLHIPYFVTGGMAVVIWGRPRFTADIDTVIQLQVKDIDALSRELHKLGGAGYVDKDTIRDALLRKGEFNFIDGNTGMKIDFWIAKEDAFDIARFRNKKAKKILNHNVAFSSPEDLILIKSAWYKESGSTRHLEDIESILTISKKFINKGYLTRWSKQLGTSDVLAKFL